MFLSSPPHGKLTTIIRTVIREICVSPHHGGPTKEPPETQGALQNSCFHIEQNLNKQRQAVLGIFHHQTKPEKVKSNSLTHFSYWLTGSVIDSTVYNSW